VNGSHEEEYGRLVQLKHNGEDGAVVKIHGEILIGSRPPANICIKSSLISKQHARITIDSKKNVSFMLIYNRHR
jgi:pSer/pThr/pTyr-binding forkhead associated (FHA) protein